MKKLLILALALILAVFSCLLVACDDETESSSSESEQESQSQMGNESESGVQTESESQSESESETESQKPENAVTVKFDTQGVGEIDDVVIEKGEKVSKPSDPEKVGYTFDGWYVDGEKWSFVGYTVTEDMTLTAKWTPTQYTITFEGAVLNPDIKYTIEDSVTLPEVIVKTGYTFEGWFEDEALAKPISKIEKGTFGDKTIYGASVCVGLEFTLVNDEYSVTGYDGVATDVIIPSFYKGKRVTSIGNRAFKDCTLLASVTITDSVTSIGYEAFEDCTALTSVNYLGTIEQWCDFSFETLDANPLYYGSNLYLNGELITEIVIPNTVTKIKQYAFSGCTSLTSVTIPNSVTEIGYNAFLWCDSLTGIEVDKNNEAYKSIDGNLYSKDGKTLIQYAIGKKNASFVIPNSVTTISDYAFPGCTSLTSVTIPNSVTEIGYNAFLWCDSLTVINCEAKSQPDGWDSNWKYGCDAMVVWGYKGE